MSEEFSRRFKFALMNDERSRSFFIFLQLLDKITQAKKFVVGYYAVVFVNLCLSKNKSLTKQKKRENCGAGFKFFHIRRRIFQSAGLRRRASL